MELITPNGRIGTPHWRIEDVSRPLGQTRRRGCMGSRRLPIRLDTVLCAV